MNLRIIFIIYGLVFSGTLLAQRIPNETENIEYLVTFGNEATASWGDDDYTQVFFFFVPSTYTEPFYFRIYDPDIGGAIDEPKGEWNTTTRFSIYGGKGAHSNKDAIKVDPVGNYKSGNLLDSKVFTADSRYDEKWYTFGPFNPIQGEDDPKLKRGRVFKVIAQGVRGDDGNLYQYFLSADPDVNEEIEGANAFTYEYSFRLPNDESSISHIYPFIEENVVSITQHNFDFDFDGDLLLYSVSKNRHKMKKSSNLKWASSVHEITEEERNSTVEIQIIKQGKVNNNMVFFLRNQYDEAVQFYAIPIGGPPRYKYIVNVEYYTK